MTLYGWDASHFDGLLSGAILARAKTEGFVFFTHKIAEGLSDTESGNDNTALAAARDAGIEFVGGYFIPRTLDSVAQVDHWWQLLNEGEPWWRDYSGWFNQIDLERWPYDNVSAAKGIDCAKRWRDKTDRQTILYASRGQYGDQLANWDGPLWNADYVSNNTGYASALYPGDNWSPGWAPYSGQEPTILQFTSSATIAGLTTCDANAYRGTIEELRALITGKGTSMAQVDGLRLKLLFENWSPTRQEWIAAGGNPAIYDLLGSGGTDGGIGGSGPNQLAATLAAIRADIKAVSATATATVAPTQDQVNAAMLNALQNPDVVAALGAAVASHIHVS